MENLKLYDQLELIGLLEKLLLLVFSGSIFNISKEYSEFITLNTDFVNWGVTSLTFTITELLTIDLMLFN